MRFGCNFFDDAMRFFLLLSQNVASSIILKFYKIKYKVVNIFFIQKRIDFSWLRDEAGSNILRPPAHSVEGYCVLISLKSKSHKCGYRIHEERSAWGMHVWDWDFMLHSSLHLTSPLLPCPVLSCPVQSRGTGSTDRGRSLTLFCNYKQAPGNKILKCLNGIIGEKLFSAKSRRQRDSPGRLRQKDKFEGFRCEKG